MRKVIYHAQTTVDGRLARADGELWEHFPWGETEIGHVNRFFGEVDTWALGRRMYDEIVPFWAAAAAGRPLVDLDPASRDFASLFGGLRIAVFSRTLPDAPAAPPVSPVAGTDPAGPGGAGIDPAVSGADPAVPGGAASGRAVAGADPAGSGGAGIDPAVSGADPAVSSVAGIDLAVSGRDPAGPGGSGSGPAVPGGGAAGLGGAGVDPAALSGEPSVARTVLRGDPAAELAALKRQPGRDIMLSCGPELLAEVVGLVDAYLLAVSPVVLGGGKRIFDHVGVELPLRLTHSQVFDGGAVVLRYDV